MTLWLLGFGGIAAALGGGALAVGYAAASAAAGTTHQTGGDIVRSNKWMLIGASTIVADDLMPAMAYGNVGGRPSGERPGTV